MIAVAATYYEPAKRPADEAWIVAASDEPSDARPGACAIQGGPLTRSLWSAPFGDARRAEHRDVWRNPRGDALGRRATEPRRCLSALSER